MDANLFTQQDAAALLAIRAANEDRTLSLEELHAAFVAGGLLRDPAAAPPPTGALREADAGS